MGLRGHGIIGNPREIDHRDGQHCMRRDGGQRRETRQEKLTKELAIAHHHWKSVVQATRVVMVEELRRGCPNKTRRAVTKKTTAVVLTLPGGRGIGFSVNDVFK